MKTKKEKAPDFPILIDSRGMQIKLPKTRRELALLLETAGRNHRRAVQDEVLYLQGRQEMRYSGRNMSPVEQHSADMESVMMGIGTRVAEPRPDIIKALADLGQANAKIAYSLMMALRGRTWNSN